MADMAEGISDFDWFYDTTEQFYVLEGEVEVDTVDGQKVRFGAGDFVTCPRYTMYMACEKTNTKAL